MPEDMLCINVLNHILGRHIRFVNGRFVGSAVFEESLSATPRAPTHIRIRQRPPGKEYAGDRAFVKWQILLLTTGALCDITTIIHLQLRRSGRTPGSMDRWMMCIT